MSFRQTVLQRLNKLHPETMRDVYLAVHPEEGYNRPKRDAMTSSLLTSIEEAGVKFLIATLRREDMKKLAGVLSLELKGDNPNSKQVLGKRLAESISAVGIDEFLRLYTDEALQDALLEDLDIERGKSKDDTAAEIARAVRESGIESFFLSLNALTLRDVCHDLKLKTRNSTSKRKLAECIAKQRDLKKEPKAKRQRAASHEKTEEEEENKKKKKKKKQDIKKGITYDEIFQHYYAEEMRAWCREHGLKTFGKKSVLIDRILAFLNGDKTTISNGKRGRKPSSDGKPGTKGNEGIASDAKKDHPKGKKSETKDVKGKQPERD